MRSSRGMSTRFFADYLIMNEIFKLPLLFISRAAGTTNTSSQLACYSVSKKHFMHTQGSS